MSRRTARKRMALKAAASNPTPAPKKAVAKPAKKAPAKKVVKKPEKKAEK